LNTRTYVISGASRGIGFELVKQLLAGDVRVAACVRDPSKAEELRALAKAYPEKLFILPLDVRSDESAHQLALSLPRDAGFDRIDVLINNAGVYLDSDMPFSRLESQVLQNSFDTNTIGPMRLTKALLPLLKRSSHPKVMNISSIMGSITETSGSSYAYRMSKAALNMFTKCLAGDEKQLTVFSLHPGWVKTAMGGAGAMITPEKSAKGLLEVIGKSNQSQSGKFFDYTGKEIGW
jgi:NAD(P)-dependent dehydrogenase (short-subunit alcohol dehydrogenase family)